MPRVGIQNRLKLLVMSAAVDKQETQLENEIYEQIRSRMEISPKKLTLFLENKAQPTPAERCLLVSILKDYIEDIKEEDLITKPISPANHKNATV